LSADRSQEKELARHLHSGASHGFADWYFLERDQRAFMRVGLRFCREAYARIWREAGEEPWYEGCPEQLEVFEDRVAGLHEGDYEWMLLGATLREAVTGFEVYLEKAREEVLRRQGEGVEVPRRSPRWHFLVEWFASIGAEVDRPEIERVRDLRHFLTHRGGELRTEDQRRAFAPEAGLFDTSRAELSEAQVIGAMDILAAVVLEVDRLVELYTWGGHRLG
jgi:hypothetical protein